MAIPSLKQSAINECGDQLFLDTADAERLNVVGANLGISRPLAEFDDAHWRLAVKSIALRKKLVRSVFERILEVCLGPEYSRATTLSAAALAGDPSIFVNNSYSILQVGKLLLDEGTVNEELVDFTYRDKITNEVFLKTPLQFPHAVTAFASNYLVSDTIIGGTSLLLLDTSLFPTAGYPYTILVDQGTIFEESVIVSNNNTLTNTLTCSALRRPHKGFHSAFVKKNLVQASPIGRTFVQIQVNASINFPPTGFIRVNKDGINTELKEYTSHTPTDGFIFLKSPLANAHITNEPVDLQTQGAVVSMAQVRQPGYYWQLFSTTPHNLHVFITPAVRRLRLLDASYLHGTVPAPFATTLALATLTTDTILTLTSVAGLPDEAGMLLINGTQVVFYTLRDELTNQVTLTQTINNIYGGGTAAVLLTVPYLGTSLEDGNMRTSLGVVQLNHFSGPYTYDYGERAPSATSSGLTVLIPNTTNVVADQKPGRTSLEVEDASLWTAFPQPARVGQDSGFQEDRTVTAAVLKKNAGTTVAGAGGTAGTKILNVTSTASFPTSDGTNPAGYRISINAGNPTAEIVRVDQVVSPLIFSTELALVFNHVAGETITLLSDVVTTGLLSKNHVGKSLNPTKLGHKLQPFTSQINLVSSAGFTTSGGVVWLNYGKSKIDASSLVTVIGGPLSYTLQSTLNFPTTGYPYQVIIGKGTFVEERVNVTNNNTGGGILTLAAPGTLNTHVLGETVEFTSGNPETTVYNSVSGNNLIIDTPIILDSKHLLNENAMLSPSLSNPRTDGFSFDFKMPPDFASCFIDLFGLVKAAGVKIVVTDKGFILGSIVDDIVGL